MMETILIAAGIFLLLMTAGVISLGLSIGKRMAREKTLERWNCRCTLLPQWTNLKQAEDRMIRNAKNFMVQAQNAPVVMGVDWGYVEELMMGKERKMMEHKEWQKRWGFFTGEPPRKKRKMDSKSEKKPRLELMNKFVQVFSGTENFRVQKMLFEHGYTWGTKPGKVLGFNTPACIFLHTDFSLTWTSNFSYAKDATGFTEISVSELKEILNKGKEKKMKTETVDRLGRRYVRTLNPEISAAVQNELFKHGFVWGGGGRTVTQYTASECLFLEDTVIMQGTLEYAKTVGSWKEISISDLMEFLSKPSHPHTLMTRERFLAQFDLERGLEGALEDSIEKWGELLKVEDDDVNWEELTKTGQSVLRYMRADTCGLCKWFHHNRDESLPNKDYCFGCCLVLNGVTCSSIGTRTHPWFKARDAAARKDRQAFVSYAKEIHETMKDALAELRKPKQYKLGQCFLLDTEDEEEDVLVVLSRTNKDHIALVVVQPKGDRGNMWSKSVGRGEGSSSIYYTQNQITLMSAGHKVTPVDVDVNVVVKEKK